MKQVYFRSLSRYFVKPCPATAALSGATPVSSINLLEEEHVEGKSPA